MFDRQTAFQSLLRLCRRRWLPLLLTGFFGVVLLAGAPAWAAPVPRPPNQTVPRPTPTTEFDPVATATPRPDATPSADATPQPGPETETGTEADPSDLFGTTPTEAPAAPAELLATVGVNALNLREGPGTTFNVLGSLAANSQVTVVSRNDDATWWYVCCLPGTTTQGWASALLLNPSFDRNQAMTLLPLFGAPPVAPPAAAATATPQPGSVRAAEPLQVGFRIDPPFVWQGITATLTISVTNPNAVDVVLAELSDELPSALTLLDARATAGGVVETVTTPEGRTLLLFRWAQIPAGTGVSALIDVEVDDDLPPGAVIDNLVGVRAGNADYGAGAFTIGMPPLFPPVFD